MSTAHLPSLTDEELVRHASFRPALSSLESELLRRLEARMYPSAEQELRQALQELRQALQEAEDSSEALREELEKVNPFLVALRAADITDTVTLTKRLRIASAAINLFHTINH